MVPRLRGRAPRAAAGAPRGGRDVSAGCAECGATWPRTADLVAEFNREVVSLLNAVALHGVERRPVTGGCEVTFCPRCLNTLGLVVRDDETGADA